MSSAVNGMRLAREDAGDDLPDAAEAGDDHVPVVVGQRVVRRRGSLAAPRQQSLDLQQDRRRRHRQRDDDGQQLGVLAGQRRPPHSPP